MIIEIRGVGFVNKGAELMLHAVLQKVSEKLPQAKFVLTPSASSYQVRAKLGLYQKLWFSKYGIPLGMYFGRFIPKRLRDSYGLVCDEEIQIVLDASGFAYSDQWGPHFSVFMAKDSKKWKKQGTKIILLPQAMGPFTSKKIRRAFTQVVENADLVFPRDDVSYEYVTELVGDKKHVIQAPDFTNQIKGVVPEKFKGKENLFCIIPNYRMIDMTSPEEAKKYLTFLVNCVKHLFKNDIKPFILIHEGEGDLRLSKEINKQCGEELVIVRETDPLKIKGIIGACEGVISSRFHGLVSALSQGVPALATGWSHKYKMLFTEYGFSEGYLLLDAPESEIGEKLDLIVSEKKKSNLKVNLSQAAEIQKQRTEKMWEKVFGIIGSF